MSLTKGRCAAPGGVVGAHRHPPPPLPLRTRHQRPRLRRPAADNDDPAAALNQVSDILRKYGSGGSAGEVQSAGLQGECSGRAASAPGGHLRPELLAWAGQGKTLRAHGRVLHAAFYRRACCSCPVISREPSHHTLHALLPRCAAGAAPVTTAPRRPAPAPPQQPQQPARNGGMGNGLFVILSVRGGGLFWRPGE